MTFNPGENQPRPSLPSQADIVVIGAGAIGAMATLHLQQAGFNTVCVEAYSKNFGSSLRSAAAARQQFGMEANIAMQIYSVNFFRNFPDTLGGTTPPMLHVGYHFTFSENVKSNGTVKRDPEAVIASKQRRVEKQKASGLFDVELLLPAQINKRFPYVNTDGLACSTFCPSDGFCFPDVITGDAFERAESLGAKLFQNTIVQGFRRNNDGLITHVCTSRGDIRCNQVVNTTGVWSPRIAAWVGTELPIKTVRRYLYFMGPNIGQHDYNSFAKENNLPLPLEEMPFTVTPNGAYARPDHGLFMMGWDDRPHEAESFDLPDISDAVESQRVQDMIEHGFHLNDDPSYGEEMCLELSRHLPFLAEHCGFAKVTTGFYEITRDHSPIIDRDPNAPNLIHCAGFSGHGIMQSPAAGKLVTEIAEYGRAQFVDPFIYSLAGLQNRINGQVNARPAEDMVI